MIKREQFCNKQFIYRRRIDIYFDKSQSHKNNNYLDIVNFNIYNYVTMLLRYYCYIIIIVLLLVCYCVIISMLLRYCLFDTQWV